MSEDETTVWQEWCWGLGSAMRGTAQLREIRVLEGEAIGPHPMEAHEPFMIPVAPLPYELGYDDDE